MTVIFMLGCIFLPPFVEQCVCDGRPGSTTKATKVLVAWVIGWGLVCLAVSYLKG